jgi:hypothetical protein
MVFKKGNFALLIWCNICNTELIVPENKLTASLEFDEPYRVIKPQKECKVIKVDFKKKT